MLEFIIYLQEPDLFFNFYFVFIVILYHQEYHLIYLS